LAGSATGSIVGSVCMMSVLRMGISPNTQRATAIPEVLAPQSNRAAVSIG
jgi:hypothetical protein